jgi:hypothetical protein
MKTIEELKAKWDGVLTPEEAALLHSVTHIFAERGIHPARARLILECILDTMDVTDSAPSALVTSRGGKH